MSIIKELKEQVVSNNLSFFIEPERKGHYIEFVLNFNGKALCSSIYNSSVYFANIAEIPFLNHLPLKGSPRKVITELFFWINLLMTYDIELSSFAVLKYEKSFICARVKLYDHIYDIFPADFERVGVPFSYILRKYGEVSPRYSVHNSNNRFDIISVYKKDGQFFSLDQLEGRTKVERVGDIETLRKIAGACLKLLYKQYRYDND